MWQTDRTQGSTLILALLIISAVSSMAFAAGRLFVAEVRISSGLEDSNTAYYAAESGINRAVADYRTNRNSQVCLSPPCIVTSSPQPQPSLGNGAMYDLKMWYLGQVAGDTDGNGLINETDFPATYSTTKLRIDNNQSRVFDLTKLVRQPNGSPLDGELDMYFRYYNCTGSGVTNNEKCVNIYGQGGRRQGPVAEIRLVCSNSSTPTVRLIDGVLLTPTITTHTDRAMTRVSEVEEVVNELRFSADKAFKIVNVLKKIPYPCNKEDLQSMVIKTFGADLGIGFSTYLLGGSGTALIDTGLTTVDSTGFFGRSKRKLQATIDRTSNSLIGIFDFTLFSQSGF